MLDSDLVGIARISDRVITWHNRAVARIFGYEVGELNGQPSRVLYGDDACHQAVGRCTSASPTNTIASACHIW